MNPCDFEARIEKLAHCRAVVLQAIHAQPGMTYTDIREWINEHKRFRMESVGRRCREIRDSGYVELRTEGDNRVHVYPAKTEEV